jgi:hypothetical protein
LLVVLVVGAISAEHIGRSNRTSQYSIDDYLLLREIVDTYDELAVTPHVLTETSNLLGQFSEPLKRACFATLAEMVPQWREDRVAASALVREEVFLRLGLADSSAFHLSATDVTVLTDDLDLYLATSRSGRRSINFAHRQAERGLV